VRDVHFASLKTPKKQDSKQDLKQDVKQDVKDSKQDSKQDVKGKSGVLVICTDGMLLLGPRKLHHKLRVVFVVSHPVKCEIINQQHVEVEAPKKKYLLFVDDAKQLQEELQPHK
jgi:hypothetical protein